MSKEQNQQDTDQAIQEMVMNNTSNQQTIEPSKLRNSLKWLSLLLLAALLTACDSDSKQNNENNDNNAYVSFSMGLQTQAHDTLSSLIITIRNASTGGYITSGDILPTGNLILQVPPHVAMTVEALGYEGSLVTYETLTPTAVAALRPGETTTASFSLTPVSPPAEPGTPLVQPGNGATGVSVLATFTADVSELSFLEITDASLVLSIPETQLINTVFTQSGNILTFTLPVGTSMDPMANYDADLVVNYIDDFESPQTLNYSWSFSTNNAIDYNAVTDPVLRACIQDAATIAESEVPTDILDLNCIGGFASRIDTLNGIEQLSNVINLNLRNNNIQSAEPLRNLTNLQTLLLSECGECGNNRVRDLTPLQGLVNLIELDLRRNGVSDLTGVEGLQSLEILRLDGNSVADISALSSTPALRELYLWSNVVVDISPLYGLNNLEIVEAPFNLIESVDFAIQTNLLRLEFWNNRIRTFSVGSVGGNTPNLAEVRAENNYITSVNFAGTFPSLEAVNFNFNNIKDITGLVALSTSSAATLDIRLVHNIIEDVTTLNSIPGITYLNLNNNNIMAGVPGMANLVNSTYIGLRNNAANVCSEYQDLDIELDLSNGAGTGIVQWSTCFSEPLVSNLVFGDTPSGAALSTCINATGIANVVDLTTLSCRSTSITDLAGLEQLPFLTSLDLANNAITNFSPLTTLTNLQQLNLNNTGLSNVNVIANLKNLQVLWLESNPFISVGSTGMSLDNLVALTELYLFNNQVGRNSSVSYLRSLINATILDFSCSQVLLDQDFTDLDMALDGGDGSGANSGIVRWACNIGALNAWGTRPFKVS